jgi:hypothetical protein
MKRFPSVLFVLLVVFVLSTGCGDSKSKKGLNAYSPEAEMSFGSAAMTPQTKQANQPAAPPGAGAKGGADQPATERKIQFSASIRMVVEDFDNAGKQLEKLVEQAGENKQSAYISSMEISGSAGSQRTGTYTIRVPVARFQSFRDSVLQLGEVETNSITSDDRTMEYYDLEDRIKAKKKHREELDKFFAKAQDVKDLREISEDIHRVQEQLDQMQGQFNRLGDLTSMTTVTVTLIARANYIPPQAPDFATQISRTFWGSLDTLLQLGQWLVLLAVGLAPWLPVLAIIAAVIWVGVRRRRVKKG